MNYCPRQPLDPFNPTGYMESDNDYILNNHDLVIKLLDDIPKLLSTLEEDDLSAEDRLELLYNLFDKIEQ